jgi:hypothetical protein
LFYPPVNIIRYYFFTDWYRLSFWWKINLLTVTHFLYQKIQYFCLFYWLVILLEYSNLLSYIKWFYFLFMRFDFWFVCRH